jgi:hypothetical protein
MNGASSPEVDHAGHAMDPATDGPWSDLGRNNPKTFQDKRWEMIAVPGYGHMYLNTENLSRDLICEALRDNPAIMADRAMPRKARGCLKFFRSLRPG